MPCRDGRAEATYRADDGTCDYCGSLNPDVLMARLEKGDVELTPTDKSYKVYVRNLGGEKFKQAYRTDNCRTSDTSKWAWVVEEHDETKFYFEHLTHEQQERFVQLLNEHKLHLGFPGYFYRLPFFCRPREERFITNGGL